MILVSSHRFIRVERTNIPDSIPINVPFTTFLTVVRKNESTYYGGALFWSVGVLAFSGALAVWRLDPWIILWLGIVPSILIWQFSWMASPATIVDSNILICHNCEKKVSKARLMASRESEVLGVTESTRAVKSSNPVVGLTNTGGHVGVGIGAMQSTSHVPVKLGKVKFTVSCPACGDLFSWIERREVVQWNDPSGHTSYEIPGRVEFPVP